MEGYCNWREESGGELEWGERGGDVDYMDCIG